MIEAEGPYAPHADELMLFGQFVGSWDIESRERDAGGDWLTTAGEWHFAWALGGHAIQDVLFPAGAPAHERGTSLRAYDPLAGTWHVTWMRPAAGELAHLTGGPVGDEIVLEGTEPVRGRSQRWIFSEVTADSFLWTGQSSAEGSPLSLDHEMRARRRL